jgi:hypothetical protein
MEGPKRMLQQVNGREAAAWQLATTGSCLPLRKELGPALAILSTDSRIRLKKAADVRI